MTAAAPLPFPTSRTLAGWWRQLAPAQPRGFWFGHLLLHRVEALTRVTKRQHLDPFALDLLHVAARTPGATLDGFDARLHLGRQVLAPALRALAAEGLLAPVGVGWTLTEVGRLALTAAAYPRPRSERRTFAFVEHEAPARELQFLSVNCPSGQPWPSDLPVHTAAAALGDALCRPATWKQRRDFPADIEQLVTTEDGSAWQCVVVDRTERLPTAVVRTPDGRLVGYAVQQESWSVQTTKPAFVLGEEGIDVLPELAVEPPEAAWRESWRTWCQPRGLPVADVEAAVLRRDGPRLHVAAPAGVVERLRASRSDVFKGEAWLLAGAGRIRPAAVIELVETTPAPA